MLESAYELPKDEIARVLERLLENQACRLQDAAAYREALEGYGAGAADFADCLVLAAARAAQVQILTFDRRLARSPGLTLAGPAAASGSES